MTAHETGTRFFTAHIGRRTAAIDGAFVAAVTALSCLPYVRGLGFYSDDWSFLSTMRHAGDSTLAGLYDSLLPHGLGTRPVQAILLAGLYSAFGLNPLGYHVVNVVVFVATVVLFHLALRELGLFRPVALAVPVIFALLPNYSTDRFWIAAFQANVSMGFYMLSLYADLRFAVMPGARRWAWKATGTSAALGSVLAYEVAAPLFVLTPVLVWLRTRARREHGVRVRPVRTALIVGTNVIALAAAVAYKLTTTARAASPGGRLPRFARTIQEATAVHFGEYGIGLPAKVLRVVHDYRDPLILAVSAVVGLMVLVYVRRSLRSGWGPMVGRRSWLALVAAGGVVFGFGYAVSLMAAEIGFHPTGVVNRTAIAATLGVALAYVSLIGWASGWVRSDRLRCASFSALVALLSATGCLLTNTIGASWVAAADEQRTVIDAIRRRFPSMPARTALLLDGVCRYIGPGVVFETSWDVRGMLQVVYDDSTLRGNVVRPGLDVRDEGVRLTFWGDMVSTYPYGDRLLVFDVRTSEVVPLGSSNAARTYFSRAGPARGTRCPAGQEGSGAPIF